MSFILDEHCKLVIDLALKEDIGKGDITSNAVINDSQMARFDISANQDMVISGVDVASYIFTKLDNGIKIKIYKNDGDLAKKGDIILIGEGSAKLILASERVALNMMQYMSGIATTTKKYVDLISGTNAKILDTRKIVPLMRYFAKYSVVMGGGKNHRICLDDGILIKDNHIEIAGNIKNAVKMAKEKYPNMKIEVECDNLEQVKQALETKVDVIMFDNMSLYDIKQGVKIVNGMAKIEVSGGVNLNNIREIAKTGVDFISIGALTHSFVSSDISLNMTTFTAN